MIALDTNVLLRFALRDHPVLSAVALRLIKENDCYISRIVLLEIYQVLNSVYKLPRTALLHTLKTLSSLERMTLEDARNTVRAIEWYEGGMEFADALVLCSAQEHGSVATFDRDFSKVARKLKAQPEVICHL